MTVYFLPWNYYKLYLLDTLMHGQSDFSFHMFESPWLFSSSLIENLYSVLILYVTEAVFAVEFVLEC